MKVNTIYIRERVPIRDDQHLISIARKAFHVDSSVIRQVIRKSDKTLVVCDKQNNIMGFICYNRTLRNICHVQYAVLDKQYRGRGVAKTMMPRVINYIKSQGMTGVSGYVLSSNPAFKVFRKWGFVPVYSDADGTFIFRFI
ncbi:hypothetical protein WQ54_07190 [Bacillus sp. SA1-12]|uniref:GNAT family N-acetyltransferase n=1 Tax=Bacillus sp. SA1-12 TaxID=1455638 RepID=UPI0006250091|nr:GNAT family N-acetyltransferase [Bacillus sp. SA1-12]KKI92952.1 hypothetical protein WQ54_07190 [Bacillus sp. SA1-12]